MSGLHSNHVLCDNRRIPIGAMRPYPMRGIPEGIRVFVYRDVRSRRIPMSTVMRDWSTGRQAKYLNKPWPPRETSDHIHVVAVSVGGEPLVMGEWAQDCRRGGSGWVASPQPHRWRHMNELEWIRALQGTVVAPAS